MNEERALPARRRHGELGEALAASYLELAGYRLLARNVRAGHREIDLVVRRGDLVCLVEVRLRRAGGWVRAVESLGPSKQEHLRRAAAEIRRAFPARACRLDVIAIDWRPESGLVLTHLPGALWA
jgi:putative endonuclease